jgi:predicted Zn-dependent protease
MSMEDTLKDADRFLSLKDALGAERVLEAAWPNLNSAPAEAQHTWASLRILQNRYPEAEQLLRNAVRLEPESQRHVIALGHLLMSTGNFAGAAEAYAIAMRLDRNWPGLAGVYAQATYRAGNLDEAEKASRFWIEKAPNAQSWEMLSSVLRGQGKGAEALAAADEALKLDRQDADAMNSRGAALLLLDRAQEALEVFDALAARGVEAPVLSLNRAAAYDLLGRRNEARAIYDDAQRRWPDLPNLQQQIAARRR